MYLHGKRNIIQNIALSLNLQFIPYVITGHACETVINETKQYHNKQDNLPNVLDKIIIIIYISINSYKRDEHAMSTARFTGAREITEYNSKSPLSVFKTEILTESHSHMVRNITNRRKTQTTTISGYAADYIFVCGSGRD